MRWLIYLNSKHHSLISLTLNSCLSHSPLFPLAFSSQIPNFLPVGHYAPGYYASGGWNGVLAGISQVKNPATMWRHLVLDIGVSATPHPKKASGVSEDAWFIASDSFDGTPG